MCYMGVDLSAVWAVTQHDLAQLKGVAAELLKKPD
jgi:uncharacterized protein with HEPN domain